MISRLFYNTRFRLIAGFSISVFLMIVLLLTVLTNNKKVNTLSRQTLESGTVAQTLMEIRAHQNRTRALILEMMLSENSGQQQEIKIQINQKRDELDSLINMIQSHYKDSPTEYAQAQRLLQFIDVYRDNRERQFELIDSGKVKLAEKMGNGVQAELYEKIRGIITSFEKLESSQLRSLSAETEIAVKNAEKWQLIIGISAIIISLIMAWAMFRLLRQILSRIREGIIILSESTADILATVTEVSTGAAETATAIAETTTTIEEVRQTAQLSNEKANLVAETSQKAANIAIEGKQSVLETIEGMRKISQQMMLITESVIKLAEQSRTIAEITTTVTDIADQSNLLAVNAAIEAAKAGEQGRGFAVVAQEIRSLSEQSKQSTNQVKEILNDIQKSVNLAVQATENGNTVVETGSVLSAQSGEVIQLMTDSVTEAAEAAIQISASSQQQKAGMEQLVPAMENIKLASEQSVIGNKQTQKAAQALDELGKNLKTLIDRYKV